MATNQLRGVIQTLRRATLPREEAGLTDGQLLGNYVHSREEAAFAALVYRHGPMVWGVCRRVLRSPQDAEDAFQATFLVLVRKAASIAPREMVANWLHGVAHQTALKARVTTAKQGAREKQVTAMPEPALEQQQLWHDLQPLLDQELGRLPDKYRAVIVLCDLEGKTRKEAARHVGVPEGTVASRLATARTMLAKRLARHGLAVSGGALGAVLAQQGASASVPISAAAATIQAGSLVALGQAATAGAISVKAVALAEGVLKAMLLTKLKIAAALLVLAAVLAAGAVAVTQQVPAQNSADQTVPAAKDPEKEIADTGGLWPQWRGPNRDGVVHGVTVPKKWPKTLTEEWRVPVGEGVSSPVVVGDNVYVFTRQKEGEVVLCLDVASGKENWRSEPSPVSYKPGPDGDFPWPRSTPTVAGGRVFTLGITGILSCLDAKTGQRLWRRDCKPYPPYSGNSPLVADGLCVVHFGDHTKPKAGGGLTAFDAVTGEVKWCYADGSSPSSGSPILVDLAGERQVVLFTGFELLGVSAATGQKLWGLREPFGGYTISNTPVQYKDLLIFAGHREPPRAIRLEKGEKGIAVKQVWKAKGIALEFSSPVLAGDLLFGQSSRKRGCLFCLDARSGTALWESDGGLECDAAILNAGSVWLALTVRGQLLVVRPSGTAYERIAEYRVSDNQTWAHPVFLGDRILIKEAGALKALRIEQDAAKP